MSDNANESHRVQSGFIFSIAWLADDEKIMVIFTNRRRASYDGTYEEFKQFRDSTSKGAWFHSHLKERDFEYL